MAPLQRSGRDVVKVLQRHLFALTADDEKLNNMLSTYELLLPLSAQMIVIVKLWRYRRPTDSPNFFTVSGGRGGIMSIMSK